MYRLYSAPTGYAMGAHCILEELEVDYEVKQVTLYTNDPDPEFVRVSPHCRVPVLVDETGAVFESGAIALYLAERHPEKRFSIPHSDPRRARFLQWMFYLSSTLQPEVLIQAHPESYFDSSSDQERLLAASMRRIGKVLSVIDQNLDPGPYFCGEQITSCDFCMAIQAIWPEIYPTRIDDYPNLKRMVDLVMARPAVARIVALHDEEARRRASQ